MAELVKQLQLRPGQRIVLVNSPRDWLDNQSADFQNTVQMDQSLLGVEAILLFVNSLDEAQRLFPEAIASLNSNGLLWAAYPKSTSGVKTDVNRDRLWEALSSTGWRPVRQVALDDTWSAMRFRPADKVGK